MASPDIRDELEPLAGDTVADSTARIAAARVFDLVLLSGGNFGTERAIRTAIQIDGLLRPLTDEQLAGVQALGQALAAFPSHYRAARRAGRP